MLISFILYVVVSIKAADSVLEAVYTNAERNEVLERHFKRQRRTTQLLTLMKVENKTKIVIPFYSDSEFQSHGKGS